MTQPTSKVHLDGHANLLGGKVVRAALGTRRRRRNRPHVQHTRRANQILHQCALGRVRPGVDGNGEVKRLHRVKPVGGKIPNVGSKKKKKKKKKRSVVVGEGLIALVILVILVILVTSQHFQPAQTPAQTHKHTRARTSIRTGYRRA